MSPPFLPAGGPSRGTVQATAPVDPVALWARRRCAKADRDMWTSEDHEFRVIAAHMCRTECPALDLCRERYGSQAWTYATVAGVMYDHRGEPSTPPQPRVCEHCDGPINPTRHAGVRYCTDLCRKTAEYLRKKALRAEARLVVEKPKTLTGNWLAVCVQCHSEFYAFSPRARVCHDVKCRRKHDRDRLRACRKRQREARRAAQQVEGGIA